jgi:7,8-dihydropterin-6-yl-methyl-4-(beta-D-ribofuranosyl)aminobenzene 5'-phosphate synthase
MMITILVDDIAPDDMTPVQGFSALVETDGNRILFDTGADGDALMEALDRHGITVQDLKMVVVSHSHDDHTGGLSRLLYHNPRLPVSVPVGTASDIGWKIPREAVILGEDRPREISPLVSTTGDMGGSVPEQALLVETMDGVVVLTGCAHPGLDVLLSSAGGSASMVIGGLHDLSIDDIPDPKVDVIVACHCTPRKRLLSHRLDQVVVGEVGYQVELKEPPEINPLDGTSD